MYVDDGGEQIKILDHASGEVLSQRDIARVPKNEPEMEYGRGRSRYAIDQNRCS